MNIKSVILILFSVLVVACSRPERKILEQADSVIIDHPDSAMTLLNTIDINRLNKNDLPYYGLLYAQAQIETGKRFTADHHKYLYLAYEKYGNDTKSDKGIRANFYLGENFYDHSGGGKALKYFLNAYEKAKKLDNDYWRARTAKRVKIHFCWIRDFYEGERYAREVIEYFKKANREKDYRIAIVDHATLYSGLGWYKREYEILDSMRQVFANDQPVDSLWLNRIDYELEKVTNEINNSTRAEYPYLREGNRDVTKEINETARIFYQDMINQNAENYHRYKSLFWIAVIVFSLVLILLTTIFYYRYRAQNAKMSKKIDSSNSLKAAYDKIIHENEISTNNLNSLLNEKEETLQRMDKTLEEKCNEIEHLKNELEEKREKGNSNNQVFSNLLKEKWSIIDILCDQLFDLGQTDTDRKRILNNIEKELLRIISTQNMTETIESIDIILDGLMTRLRQQCEFLKEDDISFLGLIYAGFSVRAVCMFTGMEYQNFYVRKSRLIKRIKSSDAPDKEIFISQLRKDG